MAFSKQPPTLCELYVVSLRRLVRCITFHTARKRARLLGRNLTKQKKEKKIKQCFFIYFWRLFFYWHVFFVKSMATGNTC